MHRPNLVPPVPADSSRLVLVDSSPCHPGLGHHPPLVVQVLSGPSIEWVARM
jgi:hypothetical protein